MNKQKKQGFELPSFFRKPEATGHVLERALKAIHIEKKIEQYAAFPHWNKVVGEEVAAVAFPEKIVKGKILVVRVVDASWAQELSLKKDEILNSLHDYAHGAALEDIRFVTGSPRTFKSMPKSDASSAE